MSSDKNHGPPPAHVSPESEAAGYELHDINLRALYITSAITVIFVVISIVWLDDYFHHYVNLVENEVNAQAPATELAAQHSKEVEQLTTYQVLDKDKGVYRIPVSDAMKKVAEDDFRRRH